MRHYPTAEIVFDVLLQSSDALRYPMYFLCLSSVFMGTLVFYCEVLLEPETTQLRTLGDAMYFMWVSFSTVGYGDMVSPCSNRRPSVAPARRPARRPSQSQATPRAARRLGPRGLTGGLSRTWRPRCQHRCP